MTTVDPLASQQEITTAPAAAVSQLTGNVAVDALRERFAAQVKELTPDETLAYKIAGFRGHFAAFFHQLGMQEFSSVVKGRNEIGERARLALEAQESDDSVDYERASSQKAA